MNLKNILKGTVIVSIMVFMAKLISFVTEATLAYGLGSTKEADIYYTIIGIQQIIYPMISIGVWKIFLPEYKKKLVMNKEEEANVYSNKIITMFFIITILFIICILIFSNIIINLVVPGFDKETQSQAALFLKYTSPMYLFLCNSTIYGAMLQARNKFFGSQIREIVVQIPTIIASVFFYKKFGLLALGWSLVLGSFLRYIVELPFIDWKYKYRLDFSFKNKDTVVFLKRLPSALLTASFTQIHSLIDKMVASTLSSGSIACLNYGVKVSTLITGLFSQAISTAIYPTMAGLIGQKKYKELEKLMNIVVNVITFFIIPVSIGCIIYNKEIITILFARGAFNVNAVNITGDILAGYALGLIFIALTTSINDILYCHGKANITLKISMFSCFLTLVFDLLLVGRLGVTGLAVGTSISNFLTFILASFQLKKYTGLDLIHLDIEKIKILICSILSVAISKAFFNMMNFTLFFNLIAAVFISIIIYLLMLLIFRSRLLYILLNFIKGGNNEVNKNYY